MTETTQAWVIAANRRIPQSLKTYRTINVSRSGFDPNSLKVIHVASPKDVISDNVTNLESDDDTNVCAVSSKNALMAREKHPKNKQYIRGLEKKLLKAKKEKRNLKLQLKQKDVIIENLRKEVLHCKSVWSVVQDSSLNRIVEEDKPDLPLAASLPLAENHLKRSFSDAFPEPYEDFHMQGLSESSEECTSSLDGEEDVYSWMPKSPSLASTIDSESIEILSNFLERDLESMYEDCLGPKFEGSASSATIVSVIPGVCMC